MLQLDEFLCIKEPIKIDPILPVLAVLIFLLFYSARNSVSKQEIMYTETHTLQNVSQLSEMLGTAWKEVLFSGLLL